MHLFPSSVLFSGVALLLLPALFASAHPHLHDRSNPIPNNEIKLMNPAGGPGLVATIVLESPRNENEPDGAVYNFLWEEPGGVKSPATATKVRVTEYNELLATLKELGTYVTSGLDNRNQLWVVESGWPDN